MIDDLGGKIKTKKVGLRGKTYRYLIDKSSEDKEAKGTKMVSEKGRNMLQKIIKQFSSNWTSEYDKSSRRKLNWYRSH